MFNRFRRLDKKAIAFYLILGVVVCFVAFPEQSFELLATVRSSLAALIHSGDVDEVEAPPPVEETVNA